jgi:two-component system OmpR family sensor kinase
MDGFQRRLNASIQRKLSFTLALAILAVALVAGIFSFAATFEDARELQDDTLRQVASLLDRTHLSPASLEGSQAKDGDAETRVLVQTLDGAGHAGAVLPLPASLADGMHTLDVGGEPFRVLVKTTSRGARIAVAQEVGVRDEIARDTALRTLMPFLVLVPVLLLVVAKLVRTMFRPVSVLTSEINQRTEQELHPMPDAHLPVELRPFVLAINRLLARVAQAMEAQRRFVADAAHELRSPLTALSLQAERLSHAEMSAPAHERLGVLRQGIERGRNLLEQLLSLARAQAAPDQPKSRVSVQQVYRRVLEDLLPLAEAKCIDIGVEGTQDAQLLVAELDLLTLVKNLVDNAIRYTPEGGRVDLSLVLEGGRASLRIQDSGPGIPVAERVRVFDPFYRALGNDALGSGLGLSIVQAIAERIGAEVRLAAVDEATQSGLCVSVLLPLAAPGTS